MTFVRQSLRFGHYGSTQSYSRTISLFPFGTGLGSFSTRSAQLCFLRPGPLTRSRLAGLSRTFSSKADGQFPQITTHKHVAYWLLGSAASVFGIVVFGGLTRLTESGLSITEWNSFTGSFPPTSAESWESEFAKYRSSPEYIRLNPSMQLDNFKKIYWMEWTHRLWGRVIGLTFVFPAVYFVAKRRVSPRMAWGLAGIGSLIGVQGLLGWLMVKSGLGNELLAPGSQPPRVSQYWLAAHLGTAFVVYTAMLHSGISIWQARKYSKNPTAAIQELSKLAFPHVRRFRLAALAVTAMVFVTAMSGAFVAGLDAGLIYNEFPWMGNGLAPPVSELFNAKYSQKSDHSDLWWRNMLENPSLVQLDHRILATSTFTAIVALFTHPRLLNRLVKQDLPRSAWRALSGTMHAATLQVTLGISTLYFLVPTWLASCHQAGALALLTMSVLLSSRLHVSPRTMHLLRNLVKQREKRVKHVSSSQVGNR